jgi:hypothetical protein
MPWPAPVVGPPLRPQYRLYRCPVFIVQFPARPAIGAFGDPQSSSRMPPIGSSTIYETSSRDRLMNCPDDTSRISLDKMKMLAPLRGISPGFNGNYLRWTMLSID